MLVEKHAAHGIALHVVVVAADQGRRYLPLKAFGVVVGYEFLLDGVELAAALSLVGNAAASHLLSFLVALLADLGAKLLVVVLVAVLALGFAAKLAELNLRLALLLDGLMGEFEGLEHVVFRHLFHLALDHVDVVHRGGDHDVEVGVLELLGGGVDAQFAVDASDADLGNRAVERDVANRHGGGGGKPGERVGHDVLVGREEGDIYESVGVVVVGEKWAERTVHESGDENLVVRRAPLAAREAAGESSGRCEFLLVLDCEGHEICVGFCLSSACDSGEKIRAAALDHHRAVGLLGQFAGLDGYCPAVAKVDDLFDRRRSFHSKTLK